MDHGGLLEHLTFPGLYALHAYATGSAIVLFLALYLGSLLRNRRCNDADTETGATLPAWIDFLYPRWLDQLTLVAIVTASVRAFVVAIVTWTLLAIMVIVVIAAVRTGAS